MPTEPTPTHFADIPVHAGPFDPNLDTLVIVKRDNMNVDKEYRIPFHKFDDGRSKTVDVVLTGGNAHIDFSLSDYFKIELDDDVDTWSFEAMPGEDSAATLAILIKQKASPKLVEWPGTFLWSGSAPLVSMEANAIDLLIITTFDSGTTWLADLARNYQPGS